MNNKTDNGRKLTQNERELIHLIFGDDFDYDAPDIYFRPYKPYALISSSDVSMAPDGDIHFKTKFADLSDMTETQESRDTLIHESTHVRQHQNGMNCVLEWAKLQIKHNFNFSAAYKYDLDDIEDYSKLNFEQQASIIQHYYHIWVDLKQEVAENPDASRDAIKKYEAVLDGHVPGKLQM